MRVADSDVVRNQHGGQLLYNLGMLALSSNSCLAHRVCVHAFAVILQLALNVLGFIGIIFMSGSIFYRYYQHPTYEARLPASWLLRTHSFLVVSRFAAVEAENQPALPVR